MNDINTALWSAACKIGEENLATVTRVLVYQTPEGFLHGRVTNDNAVLFDEQMSCSKEDAINALRNLVVSNRENFKNLGVEVGDIFEAPRYSFYVWNALPYSDAGLVYEKNLSLDEAIEVFKTKLTPVLGDFDNKGLNVLGVEYTMPKMTRVFEYPGACDLIQERFDKPLFLSEDYKECGMKDHPDMGHILSVLRDSFKLKEKERIHDLANNALSMVGEKDSSCPSRNAEVER